MYFSWHIFHIAGAARAGRLWAVGQSLVLLTVAAFEARPLVLKAADSSSATRAPAGHSQGAGSLVGVPFSLHSGSAGSLAQVAEQPQGHSEGQSTFASCRVPGRHSPERLAHVHQLQLAA